MTKDLEIIRKKAEKIANHEQKTYYTNKSNTIMWAVEGIYDTEKANMAPSIVVHIYENMDKNPINHSIWVPLKFLKKDIAMGKPYSYLKEERGNVQKHVQGCEFWQISLRLGKMYFIPFDMNGEKLDFEMCLERGYVGPDFDFLIGHSLLKEVVATIPERKANKGIDICFNPTVDSPVIIRYSGEIEKKAISIDAILAPRLPSDGEMPAKIAPSHIDQVKPVETIAEMKALEEKITIDDRLIDLYDTTEKDTEYWKKKELEKAFVPVVPVVKPVVIPAKVKPVKKIVKMAKWPTGYRPPCFVPKSM